MNENLDDFYHIDGNNNFLLMNYQPRRKCDKTDALSYATTSKN